MSGKETGAAPESDTWISRSTARAFAAAVSALLIATLVVTRSGDALNTEGTTSGSAVASGTIALVDDDQGRALFDLGDMVPGRSEKRCIEVVYAGSILPVELAMRAEAGGELAPLLDVTVQEGEGGGFDSCEGFEPAREVFSGTLADLASEDWVDLGRMVNSGESRTYMIEFAVQDRQDALGIATNADFTWEAAPA
jgi:hypothetical protein